MSEKHKMHQSRKKDGYYKQQMMATTRNKARRKARWERRKRTQPKQVDIITSRMIRRMRKFGMPKASEAIKRNKFIIQEPEVN